MGKIKLTAGRVNEFSCPAGSQQSFLWDASTGLGLRATDKNSKAYVFQSRFGGKSIRITIGAIDVWNLDAARVEARRLQTLIDGGQDPRERKIENIAADVSKREARKRKTATVGEAWQSYIVERTPYWGALHIRDHQNLASLGGEVRRRLSKEVKTLPGVLAEFMPMRLSEVTPEVMLDWAKRESPKRPARVRLAVSLLKAFFRWCDVDKNYSEATNSLEAIWNKLREIAGAPKIKNDVLQKEQLAVWFEHVRKIENPIISAYLQSLLLTGARREELLTLEWDNVNFKWRGIDLKDKVEGRRQVPLTPYVAHLIASLPKRNKWVFSSLISKSGRLIEPAIAHRQACDAAGLKGLTLHGLRRSFASLTEWVDVPDGIASQIQGHKPQGVREKNYIRRPLDLLRLHADKLETWILDQANIEFDASAEPGRLRVIAGKGA
jgi:integrase